MTSHSQAAVIVYFEQVGADVVATWTGSFDAGLWLGAVAYTSQNSAWSDGLYGLVGETEVYWHGGSSPTGLDGSIGAFTGSAGFNNNVFYVAGIINGIGPGSHIHNFDTLGVTQTFIGVSLAGIGAASFNNTLAWTSSAGGTNTISYTTGAVPEPSSTALLALGSLGLAVRRRR